MPIIISLLLLAWHACLGASPQKQRRYEEGPLQFREFRTDAQDAIPNRAKTMTRVEYRYRTYGKQTARDRFAVRLRSFDAYSVFLPKESWWNHPESEKLLDHEQGHFDIAEITARRLELGFRKALKSGKTIQGTGKTLKAANYNLEQKLKKVADLANEQSLEENSQYDRQTLHGARVGKQSEFRRIQKLTLERLAKALGEPKKPKKNSGQKTGLSDIVE